MWEDNKYFINKTASRNKAMCRLKSLFDWTINKIICNSCLIIFFVRSTEPSPGIDNCVDCVRWTYTSHIIPPRPKRQRAGLCIYFFKHVKQTIKHFTKKNIEAKLHIRNVLYL